MSINNKIHIYNKAKSLKIQNKHPLLVMDSNFKFYPPPPPLAPKTYRI